MRGRERVLCGINLKSGKIHNVPKNAKELHEFREFLLQKTVNSWLYRLSSLIYATNHERALIYIDF